MDLTTAVRVFFKQMVNNHGLPFKPELDPSYMKHNQDALKESLQQLNEEKSITKSLDELQIMENELYVYISKWDEYFFYLYRGKC